MLAMSDFWNATWRSSDIPGVHRIKSATIQGETFNSALELGSDHEQMAVAIETASHNMSDKPLSKYSSWRPRIRATLLRYLSMIGSRRITRQQLPSSSTTVT